MGSLKVKIRKATTTDAERISYIWEIICAERIYSAVSIPFTTRQEKEYIASLAEREATFVAEVGEEIIGFQSLDLWSDVIESFKHVCQIGTFVLPDFRGKGIGYKLA
ncbi:MAG: GNAT family N-acetyltransferase, partial [Promethearchaeota archaeon]